MVVMLDDRPFSSEELAERWGVSAQHVRDLIRLGTLRHFRVGRFAAPLRRTGTSRCREADTSRLTHPASLNRPNPYLRKPNLPRSRMGKV